MSSKRKPYVRAMPATWWQKDRFYKFYILRESTSLFTVWFCCILLYGMFCFKDGILGIQHYLCFLRNPLVVMINLLSLITALLHTKTWFDVAPKAANIIIKEKKLDSQIQIKALWCITVVISVVLLFIVML